MTGLMDRVAEWLPGTPELDHQRRLGNGDLVDRLVERCRGAQQLDAAARLLASSAVGALLGQDPPWRVAAANLPSMPRDSLRTI